jgi:hypothetical protein
MSWQKNSPTLSAAARSIIRGLDGSYLSRAGSLIYTDTPYAFEENFETVSAMLKS